MTVQASTELLARWQAGDQNAAHELFHRYSQRLIALAGSRLSRKLAGRFDPEDVVQSALRSFFRLAAQGEHRFRRSRDLWFFLVGITLNKLYRQIERHQAQKRSPDREESFGGEADLLILHADRLAGDPSPEEGTALADEVCWLMGRLDPDKRRMLELRLQGENYEAIARQLGCAERTVMRGLKKVRDQLEDRWRKSQGP